MAFKKMQTDTNPYQKVLNQTLKVTNSVSSDNDDRITEKDSTDIITKPEQSNPIVSVDEFFYDDPNIPWKPLPEQDLKRSPCYPIIDIRKYHNYKIPFYYCKLHENANNMAA